MMWNKFIEFLTAIADSQCLLAVHMSDNGFISHLDSILLRQPSFFGGDALSVEDLPEYLLMVDIFDAFELDQRTILHDTHGRKKDRRRAAAKAIRELKKGQAFHYGEHIRRLSAEAFGGERWQAGDLEKKFEKESGPEVMRSLEKFLLENSETYQDYLKKRPKL